MVSEKKATVDSHVYPATGSVLLPPPPPSVRPTRTKLKNKEIFGHNLKFSRYSDGGMRHDTGDFEHFYVGSAKTLKRLDPAHSKLCSRKTAVLKVFCSWSPYVSKN